MENLSLQYFIEAQIAFEQGNDDQGMSALRQGVETARVQGGQYLHLLSPTVREHLCRQAERIGMRADQLFNPVNHRLRIRTLGDLQITLGEKPLKLTRKPMDLLMLLIVFGPRPVNKERVSDLLWPERDGGHAHNSFTTTLHRLRKIIGHEAIVLQNGRLSLNPDYCEVDLWQIENLLEEQAPVNRCMRLYQGPLLADDLHHWTLQRRASLRKKFVKYVLQTCEELAPGQAIAILKQALEREPLHEGFYQQLIKHLLVQKRYSEALAYYDQCTQLLQKTFHIRPSVHTSKLISDIPCRFTFATLKAG